MSDLKKEKKMLLFSIVFLPFQIMACLIGICEAYYDSIKKDGVVSSAPLILEHIIFEAPKEIWESLKEN